MYSFIDNKGVHCKESEDKLQEKSPRNKHCTVCNRVNNNATFTGSLDLVQLIGLVRCCTLQGDKGLCAWCKIYIIGQTMKSMQEREWEGQTTYSHPGSFETVQL